MKPTMNTLDFVRTVIQKFTDGQMAIWLFGGWAEELHGKRSPGQHNDVDLLYPATDFHQLDENQIWFRPYFVHAIIGGQCKLSV